MKVELLSPAGDMESLYQAVNNGADAVYISGKNYGARKYATNFTLEEIETATKYCHLFKVKIYITVNTLIYDREVPDFLEYIKKLHLLGVDALIMQDLGMIKLVKEKFPNLIIHASTQCHNHNEEGIKLLEELKVSRIVLARELSLKEINDIKTPLEKEVFIHGALCISYSGLCLFSSLILNRSGNRGECAGFCRLPYTLYNKNTKIPTSGKYLLSTKELSTLDNLKEILDSNITSLKIEGRMKSPEYVGFVTRLYRLLIDKYYNNEKLEITNEDINNLKKLYNRKFTKGYLNNDIDIVNIKTPNHQGILLGHVIKVTKEKITIKLQEELNQNDGIRFSNNKGMIANFIYNQQGLLINKGNKNDIVILDNKVALKETKEVLKTQDVKLLASLKNYPKKKLKVDFFIKAKLNSPLEITIKKDEIFFTEQGPVVEKSKTKPTTKEDIIEKISKINATCFAINKIDITLDDNIFIPLKEINNIRRLLIEKLQTKLEESPYQFKENPLEFKKEKTKLTKSISFLVKNEEQLQALKDKDINIYVDNYELYKKYHQENIYYRTPRVEVNIKNYHDDNLLVTTTGALYKYKNNKKASDIYLNALNSYTINILNKYNLERIGLSLELNKEDIKELIESYHEKYQAIPNLEIMIYGTPELMVMKYCPLKTILNKNTQSCNICKNSTYYLEDRNYEKFRIYQNNCLNYIMNYKPLNNIKDIKYYQKLGINNFRIDLLDETKEEVLKLFAEISKNM